jgi:hypothetical protein
MRIRDVRRRRVAQEEGGAHEPQAKWEDLLL